MQTLPLFNYKVTTLTNKIQLQKIRSPLNKKQTELTTMFDIEVVTSTSRLTENIRAAPCKDGDIVIEGGYRDLSILLILM
jgi:hypothetical protein